MVESIHLEVVSDDDDGLAIVMQQLRKNLENADGVEDIKRPTESKGEDIIGAKGETLNLTSLILAVLPESVNGTIGLLKDWLMRRSDENIVLKMQWGEQLVELKYNAAVTSVEEIKSLVSAIKEIE
jgi:hypothetical protein